MSGHSYAGGLAAILVGALFVAGCATTSTERLRVVVESRRPTTALADLELDPARDYVVATNDGRTTRGRVAALSGALLVRKQRVSLVRFPTQTSSSWVS
jgi:hypothetical protein